MSDRFHGVIRFGLSIALLSISSAMLLAMGGEPEPGTGTAAATMLLAIPNARIPMDGVLSGGQPTREQIEAAARAGFRTVINLRTEKEPGFEWESEAVERSKMTYIQIPVAGAEGLTRANVRRIDSVLAERLLEGPVLLHCGSGNRIGAVFALTEAWIHEAEPEAALTRGLATGLTRLEPTVRQLLNLE